MKKVRLGVLVSGGGTNLQAIVDSCRSGILKDLAEVAVVISNKPGVYALERAKQSGIEAVVVDRKQFADAVFFCARMVDELKAHSVDIVCLAGFLLKLESNFIEAFKGKILNIHPALLPKFGGKGMYGHHVHEAVLAAGECESGATVHLVTEEYDRGPTVIQECVPVHKGDTSEALAQRVLAVEHKIYPEAIKKVISGSFGG